jgi:cephalosporin-C deacetylase-like acetyl esterase
MMSDLTLEEAIKLSGADRANPYGAMLPDFIEHYCQRLAEKLPKPDSPEGWQARAKAIKPQLLHSLGLTIFPERNSLNAQTIRKLDRGSHWLEMLSFETWPGFVVSAHLYLPKEADYPIPAVLYSPGHFMENCKLEPDIQVFCANIARLGMAALVYDPIGQGERLGDWLDHGHLEPLLVGLCQEGLMVWESIRAIDYLTSRPDIDPTRIGMTGASGGGLNTFYTCSIDDRIQVSVPVCYVNKFSSMMTALRDRNWEDGVDLCNQAPKVMAYAEMSDICGLFVPKPLCIIAGLRDWMFPIAGVREVFQQIGHIYSMVGAPQNARLVEIDDEHGYTQSMRQAAYGWLSYWLTSKGKGDPIPESACDPLPAPYHPALNYLAPPESQDYPILRQRKDYPKHSQGLCFDESCRPHPGPAITKLTKSIGETLPPQYAIPSQTDEWLQLRREIMEQIQVVLGQFPPRPIVPDKILNQAIYQNTFFERVVFESEPGVEVPAIFVAPNDYKAYLPVIVYIDEWGKANSLAQGKIQEMVNAGYAVFAIDVRGIGETAATDFEATTNALMTDRPLFGQRVFDILRAVDCLWRRIYIGVQIDKGRIGCFGSGAGGLLALYAAALDERIAYTIVENTLVTYKDLILERSNFPPNTFLFDVLKKFDLEHVAGLIAPRPLMMLGGVDGLRKPLSTSRMEEETKWCQKVYRTLNAEDSFLVTPNSKDIRSSQLVEWNKGKEVG